MKRFYSQSTGCSYLSGLHATMPSDVVPITEERFLSVIGNPEHGKIRSHDPDGLPILIDPLPPTTEELAVIARDWRDREISTTQWLVDRNRDQVAAGILLTLSSDQYSELMVFRQALRDWPMSEGFPGEESKPVAPAWLKGASTGV